MIYVLFVALALMTGVAFIAGNRNILSPWVILCAMFTLSTFFAMINVNRWEFTIDAATVLIILSSLFVFGAAQQTVIHFMEKRSSVMYSGKTVCRRYRMEIETGRDKKPISLPLWQMLMVSFVLLLMLFYYFYKTYQLSLTAGNPGGLSLMLKYVRDATLNFATVGKVANLFSLVAQGAAYVFSFIFLYNMIWCGWKTRDLLLLIPLVLLFVFQILSAIRTGFIMNVAYLVIIGCILYQQKKHWNYWNTVKIVLIGAAGLCVFLLIFRFTGLMKDSGTGVSAFYSISKYIGFSIPGFNDYVMNPRADTGYMGDHTLVSVYSVLRQLGMDLPQLSIHHDFVGFTEISSNVYSCLRRYIEDYTYVGMYIIMAGLGAFFAAMFYTIQQRPQANFLLILYGNFAYTLLMFSIDDQFFLYNLSTTFLYLVVFIAGFYYCFVYRNLHPRTRIVQSARYCELKRKQEKRSSI